MRYSDHEQRLMDQKSGEEQDRAMERKRRIEMSESVGFALPKEMARVRDDVMPSYIEIGPAGMPALFLMRAALDQAAKAMAEGDVVAMVRAYEMLKGFEV